MLVFIRNNSRAIFKQHNFPLSEERPRFSCCALKPTSQNGVFRRDLMLLGLTSVSLTCPLSGASLAFSVWIWWLLRKYEIIRTCVISFDMCFIMWCNWDTFALSLFFLSCSGSCWWRTQNGFVFWWNKCLFLSVPCWVAFQQYFPQMVC